MWLKPCSEGMGASIFLCSSASLCWFRAVILARTRNLEVGTPLPKFQFYSTWSTFGNVENATTTKRCASSQQSFADFHITFAVATTLGYVAHQQKAILLPGPVLLCFKQNPIESRHLLLSLLPLPVFLRPRSIHHGDQPACSHAQHGTMLLIQLNHIQSVSQPASQPADSNIIRAFPLILII